MEKVYHGYVKFFDDNKGFGFIGCDELDEDVFLSKSALDKSRAEIPDAGQKVSFGTQSSSGRHAGKQEAKDIVLSQRASDRRHNSMSETLWKGEVYCHGGRLCNLKVSRTSLQIMDSGFISTDIVERKLAWISEVTLNKSWLLGDTIEIRGGGRPITLGGTSMLNKRKFHDLFSILQSNVNRR